MPKRGCQTELIPEIGAVEAILVDHIDYWMRCGKEKFRDEAGQMWFHSTIEDIIENSFPGMNKRKMERVIIKLERLELLISERPVKNGSKRYRLNYFHSLIDKFYSDPDLESPEAVSTPETVGCDKTGSGGSKPTNSDVRTTKTVVSDPPKLAAPIYNNREQYKNKKNKRALSRFSSPAYSQQQDKNSFGEDFMGAVRHHLEQSLEQEENKIREETYNLPLVKNFPADIAWKASFLSEEELQNLWEDSVHLSASQLPEYSRRYAIGVLKNKLRDTKVDPDAIECTTYGPSANV
jgi:hypothetical protein